MTYTKTWKGKTMIKVGITTEEGNTDKMVFVHFNGYAAANVTFNDDFNDDYEHK